MLLGGTSSMDTLEQKQPRALAPPAALLHKMSVGATVK
jgi:hypothetical protein